MERLASHGPELHKWPDMTARDRIVSALEQNRVVLFMKGTKEAPRCGFSAKVVDMLNEYDCDWASVDVLADEELREEIKAFASWPTIPQLYVDKTFAGGADILVELAQSGELGTALGAKKHQDPEPEVNISEEALAAFLQFSEGDPKPKVRLEIDRNFDAALDLEPPQHGDLILDFHKISLAMSKPTARRADGIRIDFVQTSQGAGFRVDNPNAPPKVKSISVVELSSWMKSGKPFLLLDVRTEGERQTAKIDGSFLFDNSMREKIEDLDRSGILVMQCHHGGRSRAAAEQLVAQGFVNVFNLEGGIDAWSREIDPSVPRY